MEPLDSISCLSRNKSDNLSCDPDSLSELVFQLALLSPASAGGIIGLEKADRGEGPANKSTSWWIAELAFTCLTHKAINVSQNVP